VKFDPTKFVEGLDEQHRLAWHGKHPVAVIGRLSPDVEIQLIPLDSPFTQQEIELINTPGLLYAGVLCMTGEATAQAAPVPTVDGRLLMLSALNPYAAFVAEKCEAKPGGVGWLKRLWSLPDTRAI
jgi:hypothetical protein